MKLVGLSFDVIDLIDKHLSLKDYISLHSTCKALYSNCINYWNKQLIFDKAIKIGKSEIIKVLQKHPKINILEKKNKHYTLLSAFEYSCCFGYLEIVELLLNDSRVDPSDDNNQAIRKACCFGHYKIVELLLNDSRVDPSANYNEAIRKACCYGYFEIVKILLNDSRVDPSDDDNQAIRKACCYGDYEIVKLLLNDSRVDPSANYNEAIRKACCYGHYKIVELLLNDSRVDPSDKNIQSLTNISELLK
jgi:ankyrin repeat protein